METIFLLRTFYILIWPESPNLARFHRSTITPGVAVVSEKVEVGDRKPSKINQEDCNPLGTELKLTPTDKI